MIKQSTEIAYSSTIPIRKGLFERTKENYTYEQGAKASQGGRHTRHNHRSNSDNETTPQETTQGFLARSSLWDTDGRHLPVPINAAYEAGRLLTSPSLPPRGSQESGLNGKFSELYRARFLGPAVRVGGGLLTGLGTNPKASR